MSKYEEIIEEINAIYLELNRIYGYKFSNMECGQEIINLYRKFLKLLVQTQPRVPNIKRDYELLNGNCYFYALGLPMPDEFKKRYEKLFNYIKFQLDVGEISKDDLPMLMFYTPSSLLDFFEADLDYLNIRYCLSDISAPLRHDGYKVAVFIDERDDDYHFVRQNINGVWSQKNGYGDSKIIFNDSTKFKQMCEKDGFQYLQTYEIVKPTLKR